MAEGREVWRVAVSIVMNICESNVQGILWLAETLSLPEAAP